MCMSDLTSWDNIFIRTCCTTKKHETIMFRAFLWHSEGSKQA